MSMEVLIDDEAFSNALQNKADKLPEELKNLVNTAAFAVDREVKLAAPVKTGNLQGATSIDNLSDYEKRIYVDEGIAPYALYVIKGTDPYVIDIYPVNAKALYWPGADHPVKHVQVHHPGIKGNDYFQTGLDNAQSEIQSAIDDFKSWITE